MSELDYLKLIVAMIAGLSGMVFVTSMGWAYKLGSIEGNQKAIVEILKEIRDGRR